MHNFYAKINIFTKSVHSIAMYKKYFLRNYASNKMHLKIPFPLNFPYSTSSSTKLKTQKL